MAMTMAMLSTKSPLQSFPSLSISSSFKFLSQLPSSAYNPSKRAATTLTSSSTNNTRPSRLLMGASASNFSADASETLGDVTIFTASGQSVMFKDLWDQIEGIAVVALLRHFGCFCCWELASTLKESKERFERAGVKLVAVGVGTPDKARILAERASLAKCGKKCEE